MSGRMNSEVAIELEMAARIEASNATVRTERVPALLHDWFQQQAAQTPEAVAVIAADRELTYTELEVRSNRLAQQLRALGAGPDVIVGVLLDRTADALIAILAILKAGSAYVPLDPLWVIQRLPWLLEDSKAAILISQHQYADRIPAGVHKLIFIDSDESAADCSATAPSPSAQPENLAYVIYTSGSTGRPKGVAITHRSASVFIAAMQRWFAPEELAGVLAGTSFGFDLSIFELFVTWSSGGTVILAGNAIELPELPARERITAINTVPSAIVRLLDMQAIPRSVRTVNLAGEALPGALVRALYALGHIERVWNLYGPTEDTTYSTGTVVARNTVVPSIGTPISGTQAYILDESLQPVAPGEIGMLYLGGEGLARGYLNRPDLTAASFVPDPFADQPGARMYKTGDLAKWSHSGEIQFLGRQDHQVKIRGFRIELGEIEAALSAHPGVRAATTSVRRDKHGDAHIAGYIVPANGARPSTAELRGWLQQTLPEYMIPQAFVELNELPLTPNGKVDRANLPEPLVDAASREYVGPRTALERMIAEMWREVLELPRVGVETNFFELGGHSLRAIQVISRIRKTFDIEIQLRQMFESPTVSALARLVTDALVGPDPDPETLRMLEDLDQPEPSTVMALKIPEERVPAWAAE